jgi:hypothetical protein
VKAGWAEPCVFLNPAGQGREGPLARKESEMGCRILYDEEEGMACLYDSTVGQAFGPVFYDDLIGEAREDAHEIAGKFLEYLKPTDPRWPDEQELRNKYNDFIAEYESDTSKELFRKAKNMTFDELLDEVNHASS